MRGVRQTNRRGRRTFRRNPVAGKVLRGDGPCGRKGAGMVVSAIGRLGLVLSLGLVLTGCEDGKGPAALFGPAADSSAEGAAPAASESALTVVEKDVEAPNVFDLSDEGLWDGRPSLGGVWVAHSSVKDPERVIIRNPSNGKSVVGALFRREAANPGPSLQVSSDAADALGMLAGAPLSLEVVALRRQGMPEATPADETEFPAAPTEPVIAAADGGGAAAAGVDTVTATAAAAIDEAEGIAPAADAGADVAADASATDAAVAEAVPEKKCPFWRKKKCEAERAAAATGGAVTDETAIGDPTATEDGIAVATADPQSDVIAATPIAAGTLIRAYVQIGIFSVEENAQRAADQMKAAGMTATVKSDQSQGKTFWRVIVGPAASVAERDALASRVKGIGYPDAYPVSK
jgi:rare lipoprotein A